MHVCLFLRPSVLLGYLFSSGCSKQKISLYFNFSVATKKMWVAENTRAGKSTSVLFSSKMRADSHWVHVTDMKETEDTAAKIMRPSKSSSITGSVVDQWWSGEANPWWMSVKLQGARLWAQVLLKVSSDSLVRNIHIDVLPLNYPISVCQIYIYMSVWERECVCICACVNMLFPVINNYSAFPCF